MKTKRKRTVKVHEKYVLKDYAVTMTGHTKRDGSVVIDSIRRYKPRPPRAS